MPRSSVVSTSTVSSFTSVGKAPPLAAALNNPQPAAAAIVAVPSSPAGSSVASARAQELTRRLASLELEIVKEHEAHEQTRKDLLRTAKEVELLRAVVEARTSERSDSHRGQTPRQPTPAADAVVAPLPRAPTAPSSSHCVAQPAQDNDDARSIARSSTILSSSSLYAR